MRPQGFANSKLTKTMEKTDIGLIGLAVMGENLALNMESKGFSVSVYNRTAPGEKGVVDRFVAGRGNGKRFTGTHSIRELVGSVRRPRRIMMMVRAGEAVDELIAQLTPLMEPGDVIIDGGNSAFQDTARRVKEVENRGLYFVGAGISGGEEGALHGPSIMPGGTPEAWPLVKDVLQGIAAKLDDGTPCCEWIGSGGAGHFVKTVHNGIEYGDMQLIAEAYALLKNSLQLDPETMHRVFAEWNRGELNSFLIEITARIVHFKDPKGGYLIDHILDVAGQKGTGKWSVVTAVDENDPLTLITEAVYARLISSMKEARITASGLYPDARTDLNAMTGREPDDEKAVQAEAIRDALYAAKLISYAQGFSLMQRASAHYRWDLDCGTIARIWRKGCIIRSAFLEKITEAYDRNPLLENLLFDDFFRDKITAALPAWRSVVAAGALGGTALPCMGSALSYFDGLRTADSPASLIQAQRDYFGAHTFERTDAPRGEFFHNDWTGRGGKTSSGSYNV